MKTSRLFQKKKKMAVEALLSAQKSKLLGIRKIKITCMFVNVYNQKIYYNVGINLSEFELNIFVTSKYIQCGYGRGSCTFLNSQKKKTIKTCDLINNNIILLNQQLLHVCVYVWLFWNLHTSATLRKNLYVSKIIDWEQWWSLQQFFFRSVRGLDYADYADYT